MKAKMLMIALGLAVGFGVWGASNSWNLGWGIISLLFWVFTVKFWPNIWEDKFLKRLALALLGLTLIMWIRNNGGVKVISFFAWWWGMGTLVILAKNPKAKFGWLETVITFFNGVTGFFGSFVELLLTASRVKTGKSKWWKVLVGVLIAIPAVYVFSLIFYGADPIFAKLISLIKIEISPSQKMVIDGILAITFFGAILSMWRLNLAKNLKIKAGRDMSMEFGVAGGIIAGLFLIFSLTQIPYLVVSRDVLEKQGIMLSDYTRNGYGNMLVACALGFGIIGLAEMMVKGVWKKRLILLLILEIVWIVVMATRRNWLYQTNFGLTEARLWGFTFSLFLKVVAKDYWLKIINKLDNSWLIKKISLQIVLILVLVNVVNFDWIITVVRPPNLGYGIDYSYLAKSSADGVEGWKKSLDWLEKEVDKKQKWNLMMGGTMGGLEGQRIKLEERQKNNWHWLANWNPAQIEAVKFFQDNKERLNAAWEKTKDLTM